MDDKTKKTETDSIEETIYNTFRKINKLQGMFQFQVSHNKTFGTSRIKPHQIDAMLDASSSKGYYYKHLNFPVYTNTLPTLQGYNPFHTVYFANMPSYIVIAWYVPKFFLEFHYITVQDWVDTVNQNDSTIGYVKSKRIASYLYKQMDKENYYREPVRQFLALK